MNIDEFVRQYGGRPTAFKGVGITTANDRPMAKNQKMIIEAYRDIYEISYVTLVTEALGTIIAMGNLTFNQAALVILKGTKLRLAKEAADMDIPTEDRPILPAQVLRLHGLKGERGENLIGVRALEELGDNAMCKLNELTRGQANRIINAVISTPRRKRRMTQQKRWRHER